MVFVRHVRLVRQIVPAPLAGLGFGPPEGDGQGRPLAFFDRQGGPPSFTCPLNRCSRVVVFNISHDV